MFIVIRVFDEHSNKARDQILETPGLGVGVVVPLFPNRMQTVQTSKSSSFVPSIIELEVSRIYLNVSFPICGVCE